jgi:hypothetical protein
MEKLYGPQRKVLSIQEAGFPLSDYEDCRAMRQRSQEHSFYAAASH